jgi:hypothetical protein
VTSLIEGRGARGNARMHSVEPGPDRRVCEDGGVFEESLETPLMEFRSPRRTKGSGVDAVGGGLYYMCVMQSVDTLDGC